MNPHRTRKVHIEIVLSVPATAKAAADVRFAALVARFKHPAT